MSRDAAHAQEKLLMTKRIAQHIGLLTLVVMAAGCGPNLTSAPPGPTGPTSLSPLLLPKLDGVWGGDLTLVGIAGGTGPARNAGTLACVGQAFNAVIGESNSHNLSITQTGTALTARLASAGTGLACTYSGRIGSNGTLALDAATCDAPELALRCQVGDTVEILTLELVGSSITATTDAPVSVTNLTGTAAHTYNVSDGRGLIGGLVANHSFARLTRR